MGSNTYIREETRSREKERKTRHSLEVKGRNVLASCGTRFFGLRCVKTPLSRSIAGQDRSAGRMILEPKVRSGRCNTRAAAPRTQAAMLERTRRKTWRNCVVKSAMRGQYHDNSSARQDDSLVDCSKASLTGRGPGHRSFAKHLR